MSSQRPLRIAMWSGPRNISTAMMRSWGNRLDTFVCDEPLYAHYLWHTKLPHPMAAEISAHHETDWGKVVSELTGEIPQGKRIYFQKHMTHHLLPHIDRQWLDQVTNCFLIRDPGEVITSYIQKNTDPTVEDLGFPQQREIFDWVRRRTGKTPPVLDAKDVLNDPRGMLARLCEALAIEFSAAMLSWPPGFRETDGIWAPHWYREVENSTSFRPYKPKSEQVPERLKSVYQQSVDEYRALYEHRLQ